MRLIQLFTFFLFLTLPLPCHAKQKATPGMMGALGLNTVASARMEEPGTVRLTVATLDPYTMGTLGVQIAAPFYLGLRQTALVSGGINTSSRLFPGVDLRLRLWQESAHMPEITLGLQSALGHKRMAGESLALSKRYKDLDFTAGLGWGRTGSAGHFPNPLGFLGRHFREGRAPDGEEPNGLDNWFTGKKAGLFGGVEYFTPWDGLSVKADWNADDYAAERAGTDFNAPEPWSIGLNYAPAPWVNAGAALVGGEKIMASLSVQAPAAKWLGRPHKDTAPPPMRPYRTGIFLPSEIERASARDDISLYDVRGEDYSAAARLSLSPSRPLPQQAGRAARHMANHAGAHAENLRMIPVSYGLEGREISLPRRSLEQALTKNQGSPQEIWQDTRFDTNTETANPFRDRFNAPSTGPLRLILDTQLSLSEDDSGLSYRTGLVLEEEQHLSDHIIGGSSIRLDLHNNLHQLNALRPASPLPVRSNVDDFAARRLSIGRAWLGWMTTLRPDLHIAVKSGVLEDMYAGTGGEILYRPFGKTFAIGAEGWQVFKRSPRTPFNMGLTSDHLLTGHLNAWYEFPETDLTLQARFGRYLAEDLGGTLALSRRFDNGAKMEAFATATDRADFDAFGSAVHLYSGLKFTLPLGNVKYIPEGSAATFTIAPIGRDSGQALDAPLPLYEATEPLSYRHITRHWGEIVE